MNHSVKTMERKRMRTSMVASAGILSAISAVLMMVLEFPIPFMPPFLKIDFSDIPVLVGSFVYGPVTGAAIAFVKAALHLLKSTTGGVGELADFITCIALCVPAALIYKRSETVKKMILGLIVGAVCMAVAGGLSNKFILLPFYCKLMPLEQILQMCGQVNPVIKDVNSYILFGAIPFNFIKAAIICIPSALLCRSAAMRRFMGKR